MQERSPLLALPASIRHSIEEASKSSDVAGQQLQKAGLELARTQPELLATLLAGQLGNSELSITHTEQFQRQKHLEHKVFGIRIGKTSRTTVETRTVTKTLKLR